MLGVYALDHDHGVPPRELVELLGGKGAGLAEMSTLGLDVPPGFTVSVPVSRTYLSSGWPPGLDRELERHVARLGRVLGRGFGQPDDPLLLAVRSGAPVSMPGMLDTVLDLGLNDVTVLGLARSSGDESFAWDSYRRFLAMYATTVLGVEARTLPSAPSDPSPDQLRDHVADLKRRVTEVAGRPVPQDPVQQLREAVEAVFRSWNAERAHHYRTREAIPHDLGTAVTVQAMVFGNRGPDSGTGVLFTRDPATGAPGPYGDYLPQAQGEDVVAGTARTMPIQHLATRSPRVYDELMAAARRLEVHYRDLCDIEFTVEAGRLWLLQTRVGKRGCVAAVRIAVDLADDPLVDVDEAEAVARVPAEVRARARAELLAASTDGGLDEELLATGLGASPGRVTGRVVLSAEDAVDAAGDVVLVRRETSPEDIAGMSASVGVLTTRGGLVSHAAVVARAWGLPAVVGAEQLTIDGDVVTGADGLSVRAGDVVTIDGTTGCVWRGAVAGRPVEEEVQEDRVAARLPHLERLERWALEREGALA